MKGFVISRRFIPTTNSLAIVLFKILSNSKNQYVVYSQASENPWNYQEDSEMRSPNIVSEIGPKDDKEWESEALLKCEKHFVKEGFDFLLTCVYPPFDHKIGLKFKERHPEVFWATYWGDPVANVPNVLAQVGKGYDSPEEVRKKSYENEVFEKSDLIIFTNKYQERFQLGSGYEKWKEKSLVINHPYDLRYYPRGDTVDNGRVVISHVGHLYEVRHIYHLINAIYASKYKNKFIINIIGHLSTEQEKYIERLGLQGIFKLMGERNYHDSLQAMVSSDILLSVDATVDLIDHSIFMPSKISDYLGAKKPIIFISYSKGVAADIATETNNKLVLNNEEEILKVLDSIMEEGIWIPYYPAYERYDAKIISTILDASLEEKMEQFNG